MTLTFPIPIEFSLPNEYWRPIACGADVVASAIRVGADDHYFPTLTVRGGFRLDSAGVEEIADEAVRELESDGAKVRVLKRMAVGTAGWPAVVQLIELFVTINGESRELSRIHALESVSDVEDPEKRVIVSFSMTCGADQLEYAGPEFHEFMQSVELLGQR